MSILDIEFCIDLLFYVGVWVSNNSKKGKLYGLTLNINISLLLKLTLTALDGKVTISFEKHLFEVISVT